MEIKDVLNRIGYVRINAGLSARELSLRLGMSPQYISQIEGGRISISVEKLLQILEICDFPIERFFSSDINDYEVNNELKDLIENLPENKKKNIIEFIKQ
ncbi:MAG: helix-turn-helix transcriptional regulator [Clostridia bacterium]|nr:helix-turn-helix transcriptional regulator [Clostridia bacterium]